MTYILFDIGGTKTRVAVSHDLERYDTPVKFNTPLSFEEGVTAIADAVHSLVPDGSVTALAGGIRGVLNYEKTRMVMDPGKALLDWAGRPLAARLEALFNAPVYLENDSATVGLGEAVYGAGKGHRIVAYHTVSTGVGGARIVDGKVDVTRAGFEPGHQILDIDRSILGATIPHTLENLVSGSALEKRRGVKPYEIAQDDAVWDELARYLGKGLNNTITYWSPDVIVLGGSMIVGDPRIFLDNIIGYTKESLGTHLTCPPIVDATLRDEGGLYGALALHKQHS